MISSPYCVVSEPNVYKHYKRLTQWAVWMECESMLFVENHIPYLWDLSNSFSNSFIDFYGCEGFHQVIYQEEWSIKLRPKGLLLDDSQMVARRRPCHPMKRRPTSLKQRPTGLKRRPCGLKRKHCGLKRRPTGLKPFFRGMTLQ